MVIIELRFKLWVVQRYWNESGRLCLKLDGSSRLKLDDPDVQNERSPDDQPRIKTGGFFRIKMDGPHKSEHLHSNVLYLGKIYFLVDGIHDFASLII